MKLLLIILCFFMLANNDKTDRRGFFKKIKDAYVEGRLSANEKRIAERKANEKMRRRFWFERNINKIADGMSKRLKRGPRRLGIYVVGGVGLAIWLCHKGSLGCDGRKEQGE